MKQTPQYLTMTAPKIETDRLILRNWLPTDYQPFAQMCADSEVMEFFPNKLTSKESNEMIDKCHRQLDKDNFGYWAIETKNGSDFIGFVALAKIKFATITEDNIEIGWRLKRSAWGKGYASEGAKVLLEYAFTQLKLKEVIALTSKLNLRSQKVMERIGMTRKPQDDFDHPKIDQNSKLRSHVLYRISNNEWSSIERNL